MAARVGRQWHWSEGFWLSIQEEFMFELSMHCQVTVNIPSDA